MNILLYFLIVKPGGPQVSGQHRLDIEQETHKPPTNSAFLLNSDFDSHNTATVTKTYIVQYLQAVSSNFTSLNVVIKFTVH